MAFGTLSEWAEHDETETIGTTTSVNEKLAKLDKNVDNTDTKPEWIDNLQFTLNKDSNNNVVSINTNVPTTMPTLYIGDFKYYLTLRLIETAWNDSDWFKSFLSDTEQDFNLGDRDAFYDLFTGEKTQDIRNPNLVVYKGDNKKMYSDTEYLHMQIATAIYNWMQQTSIKNKNTYINYGSTQNITFTADTNALPTPLSHYPRGSISFAHIQQWYNEKNNKFPLYRNQERTTDDQQTITDYFLQAIDQESIWMTKKPEELTNLQTFYDTYAHKDPNYYLYALLFALKPLGTREWVLALTLDDALNKNLLNTIVEQYGPRNLILDLSGEMASYDWELVKVLWNIMKQYEWAWKGFVTAFTDWLLDSKISGQSHRQLCSSMLQKNKDYTKTLWINWDEEQKKRVKHIP